jgi:hypothetical protein
MSGDKESMSGAKKANVIMSRRKDDGDISTDFQNFNMNLMR